MKTNNFFYIAFIIGCSIIGWGLTSCNNNDNGVTPPNTHIVKQWTIQLSTKYQVPAIAGRSETGQVKLTLLDSDSLLYQISVQNLLAGDLLTLAHFHVGDVLTNGPIIVDFHPVFSGGNASGALLLRQSFVDTLKNTSNQIYFNVHSQQFPSGLVRGQVNVTQTLAADVVLSGANEVPQVSTTAAGTALLRVTADQKMHSIVTVNNLESNDALTMANVYSGVVGAYGPVVLVLCNSAADFGVNKVTDIGSGNLYVLQTSSLYLNVLSTMHPSGLIRGVVQY